MRFRLGQSRRMGRNGLRTWNGTVLLAVVVMVGLAFVGCGPVPSAPSGGQATAATAPPQPEIKSLKLSTSSVGSPFVPVGIEVARVIKQDLGIEVTASPSSGTVENARLLQSGESDMALISSMGYFAYHGEAPFNPAVKNMRLTAKLYPNPVVFYALKSSGIRRMSDLAGKRVGAGSSPGVGQQNVRPVLEAHGVAWDSIKPVYAGYGDVATQVGDGVLDAGFGFAAADRPMPAIQELSANRPLAFLEWDSAAIDKLRATYYRPHTVPAGFLPGFVGPYATVDESGPYVVISDTMPEDLAYRITKAIYDNAQAMAKNVAYFQAVADHPEIMARELGDVPFHPGAIRFWKEKGYMK